MFHTLEGLRLTPAYDLVAAALYPDFKMLALSLGDANIPLADIKPKHLVALGKAYGLDDDIIKDSFENLDSRRKAAEKAVAGAAEKVGAEALAKNYSNSWNADGTGASHQLGTSCRRSGPATALH